MSFIKLPYPTQFYIDLPLLAFCLSFIAFQRVRAFFWTFVGCSFLWIVLLAIVLLSILGADYKASTAAAKLILSVAYFLPPAIAAFFIDAARHHNRRKPALEKLSYK